ncbi:hypothetical protein [Gordonia cholesterolivorans]|uniref:DUF2637 domain-containing protein n=1 Tax=Gordonia cholesterolivorans TaxID=559625 RepID=A0ABN3HCP0_9ACTN
MRADNESPKPEVHRWGFYAVVMAVCLVLSMAGNGLHVWSQWHADVAAGVDRGTASPWVPTIAVMVFPAMVMVMTEMVVISHRRNAGRVRTVVTALAAVVGLVTLAVSYVGLVYVCTTIIGIPSVLGYLAPIVVDAPIIAATVGLWDVLGNIRADAAEHVVHTPPAHVAPEPVHTVHDDVSESVQPVDLTDGLDRAHPTAHVQTDDVARPVHIPDLGEHGTAGVHDDSVHALDAGRTECVDESVHIDDRDVHDDLAQPARPVFTVIADDVHGGLARDVEDGVRALAERVHAELSPSVDVDILAELIRARRDEETPYRELGLKADVSPNTVRKWIKAAEDIQAEAETA